MTLFISENNKSVVLKKLILYIGITAFIALFGIIYEQFSHGVNSNYMWFAWIRPLIAGVGVYLLLYLLPMLVSIDAVDPFAGVEALNPEPNAQRCMV